MVTRSERRDAISSQFQSLVKNRPTPDGTDDGDAILELDDFSVFYGDFPAVHRLRLGMPRRQITAIIGPSGCGKSTLLNAINRMTDLIPGARVSGRMRLNGEEVYGNRMDVIWLRRRIGMVFQKPNPFPKSIYDNVAYGPRLHGKRDRDELDTIVERTLKESALWEEVQTRLHANAMSLSGGQQQRLCIARALAIEPQMVLLDEPTSSLDPQSTARIEALLEELRGHYTVIIVTHNMQQAARVSDYTLFLYEGEQIEFARNTQLFLNPQQEQTEEYIAGRFG
ncbi:phosphate ABC transporter ATP-binding protein [Thiohalocapsa halophila]|uniref:Phosphate ABC transporter ATP-binding protein n=1 Tax=Thiohalocapsa halophila TaxID=69359 RepID=A0ABS1CGT8_9GAMM|nr:phosphate ABC transporter ATP-binding protein PstB [Thiohalocapsa halophila]MBK1631113.1 phosphate ABC transporter ATP-binding protein [Thiohalocapsa halophila]